jgi:plastocyanin
LSRLTTQLSLYTTALAAGAGLAFAVATAEADEPTSASITAKDPYSFDNGAGGNTVSIAAGGTVTFSYPTGVSAHNVVFDTAQPTSCTGMPTSPSPSGWTGDCTFESYGTYAFHCGLHSFMTGKVQVPDPNAPPPTAPTDTAPAPGGGGPPPAGEPAPPVVKVARRQRGTVVRGSVTTPAGPSKIAVTALVAKSGLSARVRRVKIGSVTKTSKSTGTTAFSITINRAARRALHRRHRLSVSLRLVITPDTGTAVKKTMTVALRERP